MNQNTAALLATFFALYSLVALLAVERTRESTSSPLADQARISEVGLRVDFRH